MEHSNIYGRVMVSSGCRPTNGALSTRVRFSSRPPIFFSLVFCLFLYNINIGEKVKRYRVVIKDKDGLKYESDICEDRTAARKVATNAVKRLQKEFKYNFLSAENDRWVNIRHKLVEVYVESIEG